MPEATPKESLDEIRKIAVQIKKNQGLELVPILVVEGRDDEFLLRRFCALGGHKGVFIAEGRSNVEQLVLLSRDTADVEVVVGLTDCDGVGKAREIPSLLDDPALVVTQGCDAEADLFLLGAVARAVSGFAPNKSADEVSDVVAKAAGMARPISALRRGAMQHGISMKVRRPGRPKPERLSFAGLGDEAMRYCSSASFDDSLEMVTKTCAEKLSWGEDEAALAFESSPRGDFAFGSVVSGKDALEGLLFLLREQWPGLAELSYERLLDRSVAEVRASDFHSWHVGARLMQWQTTTGVELLSSEIAA